jgi:hypothetical protein
MNVGSGINTGIASQVIEGKKALDFFPNTFNAITGTKVGSIIPMGSNCPVSNLGLMVSKSAGQAIDNNGESNEFWENGKGNGYGRVLYQTSMTSDGNGNEVNSNDDNGNNGQQVYISQQSGENGQGRGNGESQITYYRQSSQSGGSNGGYGGLGGAPGSSLLG